MMKKSTKNTPIHSYLDLPKFSTWKSDSRIGNKFGLPFRKSDKVLLHIDNLVKVANSPQTINGTLQVLYSDLFFATMYWNNHYQSDKSMKAGRRPAIMKLMLLAGNKLSKLHECALGELPQKLRELHGKSLSAYGITAPGDLLKIAQRESFKIVFKKGKAYRYDCLIWSLDNTTASFSKDKLILVNTKDYFNAMKTGRIRKNVENDEQYSPTGGNYNIGYVMSMSHELYIAPFSNIGEVGTGSFAGIYPRFHSDFMRNKPVLCAGTIAINKGQIVSMDNNSGHYKPPAQHLRSAVKHFKSIGVNIKKIDVHSLKDGKIDVF